MRRAKLAPGSVPAGSLPTSACHTVPRCFVCDEPIKSHRLSTSLLAGRTQYTHSPLPMKIGGFIGDEFVVVVTPQDALCKHCMALINTMDRLELEFRQHRYTLTQHLKAKYKLDGHSTKPVSKFEAGEAVGELHEPEIIEVSDEEWTPNKRPRVDAGRHHRCTVCNASFTNLSLFMAHLSRHKQADKTKTTPPVSVPAPAKSAVASNNPQSFGLGIKFKCGCCSETFTSKESLAAHMQLHTTFQPKAKANSVLASSVNKPRNNQTVSCAPEPKLEPPVQAASLFEDIEQLSQQDVAVSVGVCSEEQKGRVCLLALLNNGVCSDVSHRAPAEGSAEDPSVITAKIKGPSDDQTISITVSIPSVSNGGQMSEQQLSFSTVSVHPSTTNLCYPTSLTNPPVMTTVSHLTAVTNVGGLRDSNQEINSKLDTLNLSVSENSETHKNSCLEMPDLHQDPFQAAVKLSDQQVDNAHDEPISSVWDSSPDQNLPENVMNEPIMPSSIHTSSMDMPSLLDDDFLQGDEQCTGTLDQISDNCELGSVQSNSSNLESDKPSNEVESKQSEALQDHGQGGADDNLDLTSSSGSDKNPSSSVENIAIVSVTSVQVNSGNFNSDNISNDWFYSTPGKELSSVLEENKVCDKDSPLPGAWFHDSTKENSD